MRGANDTCKAILFYICTINNSMTDMGKTLSLTAALLLASTANAQDIIVHDNLIKSLKVEVNDDWSLPPVLTMDSDDVMTVSFDRTLQLGLDTVRHERNRLPRWFQRQ